MTINRSTIAALATPIIMAVTSGCLSPEYKAQRNKLEVVETALKQVKAKCQKVIQASHDTPMEIDKDETFEDETCVMTRRREIPTAAGHIAGMYTNTRFRTKPFSPKTIGDVTVAYVDYEAEAVTAHTPTGGDITAIRHAKDDPQYCGVNGDVVPYDLLNETTCAEIFRFATEKM